MSSSSQLNHSAVVGITIGSVYSSVAVIDKDGHPNVIANEDGERMIPTSVAFRGEEIFAGSQAHNQAVRNPKNTLYGFFDLLGLSSDSDVVKQQKENVPYTITEKDGKLAYEVEYKEKPTTFSAHEIAVTFLKTLKETALTFINTDVSGTVIAVPTYFTEEQRKCVAAAANEAGLKVEQVANEASVALLAYDSLDHNSTADKTVVVADLGGSSLDVTLISAKQGIYTVLASEHCREIGGLIIDDILVQHFAKEFKTKSKIDITGNQRALAKLRVGCELTKKTLSSTSTAPCSVESLADGVDYHGTVNRVRFEILSNKLFNKAISTIEKVVESAGYHASDVDEVVLIGGASRIPKLQSKIRDLFPENTQIRFEIETDEAVSRGCVMQASLLLSLHETEDVNLEKLAAEEGLASAFHIIHPIGLVDGEGKFQSLIHQDTPLPLRRIFRFPAGKDSAYVSLFEGEKEAITIQPETPEKEEGDEEEPETPESYTVYQYKASNQIAELGLTGLTSESQVELQIQIDENSKLQAILRDLKSGQIVKTA